MLRTVSSKEYAPHEVLNYVTVTNVSRTYEGYPVWMNSLRYQVFQRSCTCAHCGVVGSVFLLQQNEGSSRAHFNLYAKTPEGLVLMTKDHIHPKSKGGKDKLDNLQTLCYECNKKKGNTV